jgi:hypothetical protein
MKNLLILLLTAGCLAPANPPAGGYSNDFEKLPEGKLPDDLVVLNGGFTIKAEQANKLVELPGEPLDTFGFLLGPEGATQVSGRIRGDATGKRMAEFGLGLGGAGGWRLWMMPAVGELQLVKDDEVRKGVKVGWRPGTWTWMKLRMSKIGEKRWRIEGKAWEMGKDEPGEWMIRFEDEMEPQSGRATAWGIPYSGKAMGFDDLRAGGPVE